MALCVLVLGVWSTSQWIFKQSARSVSCRQDGLFKADLKLALLAAQELKYLPPVSGCLQAKQNLMLSLREHKNGLLSALPHAVGLLKRDINVPVRANASALGSLDRLESSFCSSSSSSSQISEAINKNIKIIHLIKVMSLPETLRPL